MAKSGEPGRNWTISSSDYDAYMDVQQAINLELYSRFASEGIEFAFPTQTLYVEGEP